jgi:hypothetical protein
LSADSVAVETPPISGNGTLHVMQFPTGASPSMPIVGAEEEDDNETDTSQATVEPPTPQFATLTAALHPQLKVRQAAHMCIVLCQMRSPLNRSL